MGDLALPQSLSISDVRRNAMPAIRRSVFMGSTSQNTYGEGELVYIPVDTGTAGAFFVPETSRIDMTVNIYNKNYFVDFINLPRCGFHALIEEFGIEIHNSLHENQRFYAEMIENDMIRNGENSLPYEMTVSNPHEVGGGITGTMHINFIKPSMVTTAGLPHGVRYAVMIQPQGSNISSSVANIMSEGLLLNSHPYVKQPLGRNGYGTIPLQTFNNGSTSAGQINFTGSMANSFGMWAETSLPSSSTYDDRITRSATLEYSVHVNGPDVTAQNTTTERKIIPFRVALDSDDAPTKLKFQPVNSESGSSYGYDLQVITPSRFTGYAAAGGRYSKVIPRTKRILGQSNSDNSIFDVDYGQTVGGYTPMMWPAKQPCNLERLFPKLKDARKGINTKNVQNYFANCKNIVVSIPVDLTNDPYGEIKLWGDSIHTVPEMSDATKGQLHSFRVSLKLYSCLLGVYARKWFPSLLIGAGRMRIRMRLQRANIAFQTLMDPCRVVPGTVRDRFPYLGVHSSPNSTNGGIGNLVDGAVSNIAHSVHPIMISNYIPGACFNDLVAMGRFPTPQQRMKAMNKPFTLFNGDYRRGGGNGFSAAKPSTGNGGGIDSYFGIPGDGDETKDERFTTADKGRERCDMMYISLLAPPDLDCFTTAKDFSYKFHSQANSQTPGQTVDATAGWANQQIEQVYKILSDLTFELSRNVHYGYPSHPLITDADELVPISGLENNNSVDPLKTRIYDSKRHGLPTDPISAFQNYNYNTDFTSSWSDTSSTSTSYRYSAGDPQTSALVYHPLGQKIVSNGSQLIGTELQSDISSNSLNWDPFNYPQPQYMPILQPWDKRTVLSLSPDSFANENQVCYGTFLERSVAQVRRTNQNLFALQIGGNGAPGITERLTYTVSNIVLRIEEIILPESASMSIIASAMEGGITMEADTVKTIEQILQKQDNQKILLNVSAGIVNDVCFIFQPTEMLQGDKAYGYNSFATYCPWTSFKFQKQSTGTTVSGGILNQVPNTPDDYNYLGGEPNFYNALNMSDNIAINTFLTIATEYFPRNPINDLNTLLDVITWGDQHSGNIEYLGLDPMIHNSYDTANFHTVLPFQDGFFSVFTPIETLDDQTITDNPYFTPLELNLKKRIRGKRSHLPALPFFKPLDGTFHLSFNLQAFMQQQNRMHVGTPMVNNNSYLMMQNCHMLREYETRMITLIRCFARVVIERGGIVQIFT